MATLSHQPKTSSEDTPRASDSEQPNSEPGAANTEKSTAPELTTTAGPGPPPDGGLQAWLAVLGGFCTVFASFGWINCIGVFQDYYQNNQLTTYSPSAVAWIPSTESFMMFFWGPVAGLLADNYGPRVPILMGSFLHIFGLMMTSLSSEYYQFFLAQSVVSAIGCSLLFFPTLTAVGSYFVRHRALAFGIVVSGSSIGGVILPIMVTHLIPSIGFGWAMRSTAFLLLGLLVIANIILKSRLPPPKRAFQPKEFVKPFTELPFRLLALCAFFTYLGGFLPITFLIVQAREVGMSEELSSYLIPLFNGASTFGRIIPAQLGDVYGVFNVMIVNTLLAAIITLALWLPANANAPLIVYAILYGFTSGCTFSIMPAMVASFSNVQKIGVRSGTMYMMGSVGALIGSPIAGAIVDRQNGSYTGLVVFSGVGLFVGAAFAVASRQALVGKKVYAKI
ncbi:monocarboxylate permease-like protein [Decorospora gaudefroyi]|uniref:Monocarboxylate permease-like protein n=1 Tax=Decorospora gaudefroyi TaxID=184978 RepID=A0A6A5KAZ6_9PLEO|nr:monocarboxylate permease-like protein [Decorospora gaudefroyi]